MTDTSISPAESSGNSRMALIILAIVAIGGACAFLLFGKGCVQKPSEDSGPITSEELRRYTEGDMFRTIVNTTVQGLVENKDWGFVKGEGTFIYQGELDTIRRVVDVKDEGSIEVKMSLEIRRARDLQMAVDLGDVALDFPPMVGNRLVYVANMIPPGNIRLAVDGLRQKWVRGRIIDALESALSLANGPSLGDVIIPEPPTIQGFEGAGGDFTYRGGEGLVEATTRGNLSSDDEQRVREFSVFAESHLLPAPGEGGPAEWNVDVRDIAHLLVPTSEITATGSLRFRRGETTGGIVRLAIIKGLVYFNGTSDVAETLGSWAARGYLDYNLSDNTVVKGLISGDVKVEKTSTDHVLFESEWKAEPEYRVTILGFRAETGDDATRDISPVELDLK